MTKSLANIITSAMNQTFIFSIIKLNQMFVWPINDFRLPRVAVICAETPKSASLTSALSVSKIFAPYCQYNLNTIQKYWKGAQIMTHMKDALRTHHWRRTKVSLIKKFKFGVDDAPNLTDFHIYKNIGIQTWVLSSSVQCELVMTFFKVKKTYV